MGCQVVKGRRRSSAEASHTAAGPRIGAWVLGGVNGHKWIALLLVISGAVMLSSRFQCEEANVDCTVPSPVYEVLQSAVWSPVRAERPVAVPSRRLAAAENVATVINKVKVVTAGTASATVVAAVCHMMAGGRIGDIGARGGRQPPPAWSPDRESTYPFRYWVQDLLAWSILATEMDSAQQAASIGLQVGGAARELTRHLNYE